MASISNPTTVDKISGWLNEGHTGEYSHMVVLTDTIDWNDFPLYVPHGIDAQKYVDDYRKRMGSAYRAEECYSYSLPLEEQLKERRARHWD